MQESKQNIRPIHKQANLLQPVPFHLEAGAHLLSLLPQLLRVHQPY